MMGAAPAAESYELAPGAVALPGGLLWLARSRTLVAADVHLAYEDVIGGALPLWSTAESAHTLLLASRRMRAREIVLLGDVIHGSRMSDGAAAAVASALTLLRQEALVTLVAGNHEGRTRGVAILGETEEVIERDGWVLLHGDEALAVPQCVIGHLHPSLALGGGVHVPVFLASSHIIVVPALTPYSNGLNVLGGECSNALRAFGSTSGIHVVACSEDRVFPFGSLARLRQTLTHGSIKRAPPYVRRRRLRGDSAT